MNHKPIQLKDLGLIYPHKTCFDAFSAELRFGDRIAIIGRNGAGKSTLLKILDESYAPTDGEIKVPDDVRKGYLPQVIQDFPELSGGQRVNQVLTKLLASNPNLLLLDEPTNHLDSRNRRSLIRMLQHYQGTLVLVSHDIELINAVADILWHVEAHCVTVFSGRYHDYQKELTQKKTAIEHELAHLSRQKKEAHLALMKEQERNKQARIKGEKNIQQRKWPTIRSHSKLAKSITSGDKRLSQIKKQKNLLLEQLSSINQPEILQPKFKLKSSDHHKALVTIQDASVRYSNEPPVLMDINFHMTAKERVALCGDNGSGKSTFVKAILGDTVLNKIGAWVVPTRTDIGYLDQHYQHLAKDKTVLDLMIDAMPKASHAEIRAHLNDFLFRKNEEVHALIESLSGGEKARLSLALIAANPPRLLILDELTNNLDLETRTQVIQVLREFPGAIIVISHDEDFLNAIHIETIIHITQSRMQWSSDAQHEVTEYE